MSKYILYKLVWKLFKVGRLHQQTVLALYGLGRNGKLLKFLRILAVYFKDRNWIPKTMYCISCSVVCKIVFCFEFLDIPDNAGRVTRRRRTQAIAKRNTFHAYAITKFFDKMFQLKCCFYIIKSTTAIYFRSATFSLHDNDIRYANKISRFCYHSDNTNLLNWLRIRR